MQTKRIGLEEEEEDNKVLYVLCPRHRSHVHVWMDSNCLSDFYTVNNIVLLFLDLLESWPRYAQIIH